jgi:ABC-type multidrug transport system ATPase subunit
VRFRLRDVLLAMQQQGKTIVLSSHHLGEVEALADRLEFLLDGVFVSAERLRRARARLRQRPRVRLRAGCDLPTGARLVQREADDTLVVETTDDPMHWLQQAPKGVVESAEVGIPRLEDLYQLLLQPDLGGAP